VGLRAARARADLAELAVRRAEVAVAQKAQAISEELKVAHRGVRSAETLVTLTRAAVKVAQTKYGNELEKYRAGKSTARMVALVQADLVAEQLTLEQAVATHHQALVDLWTATGTLLTQLGTPA
jgi:outer membrane protein TolC